MPELPEVETITRALQQCLIGRSIRRVHVFAPNSFKRLLPLGSTNVVLAKKTRLSTSALPKNALQGLRFQRVYRRGKWIVFGLLPNAWLVAHLRMTGKFVFLEKVDSTHQTPKPHERVWFDLMDNSRLIFQDMRRFGGIHWVDALADFPPLQQLGIEPLSAQFTPDWFCQAIQRPHTVIKSWLLNQKNVVGLGNIYVAEALFLAGINPWLPACKVTKKQAVQLHGAIQSILHAAIQKNGTTIANFRRVDEKTGEFQDFLRVYGRAGDPCQGCGSTILRQAQQQRSTFYCPTCQA